MQPIALAAFPNASHIQLSRRWPNIQEHRVPSKGGRIFLARLLEPWNIALELPFCLGFSRGTRVGGTQGFPLNDCHGTACNQAPIVTNAPAIVGPNYHILVSITVQ